MAEPIIMPNALPDSPAAASSALVALSGINNCPIQLIKPPIAEPMALNNGCKGAKDSSTGAKPNFKPSHNPTVNALMGSQYLTTATANAATAIITMPIGFAVIAAFHSHCASVAIAVPAANAFC